MWSQFLLFLRENQIGDVSDLIAICVVFAGFWKTIKYSSSSKVASEASRDAAIRAEKAANLAREAIITFDSAVDFSSAISIMEEIKRAHRYGQISGLPDRYAAIRKLLISLRAANPDLNQDYGVQIQTAISNLVTMEKSVEKMIAGNQNLNAVKFNAIVLSDIDALIEVLAIWKRDKIESPS